MPTDDQIIKQFEQLYEQFGGTILSKRNMQHSYKIYVELKKVREKLIKAENNFLSLQFQPKTKTVNDQRLLLT
jgi:hypothetical protein